MQVQQVLLQSPQDEAGLDGLAAMLPQAVLVFGAVRFFETPGWGDQLAKRFPQATVVGCSTAGEITVDGMDEGTCTVTAVCLERTSLVFGSTLAEDMADSQAAGERVARALLRPDLKAVLVLAPGVALNGSALVRGMQQALGKGVAISGGLAGDGGAFVKTYVLGGGVVQDRAVVALGLCGDHVQVGHGSFGGWTPFGPDRKVTRSQGNVLYELDSEPALEVYKRYLGEHAKDLPASGLLFPFSMQRVGEPALIRTILGINEAEGSLTLAGEIDSEGSLQLMQASTDNLVDGAQDAATWARNMHAGAQATLAILVSCVGRKLVMGDRVDEELDAVADVLGRQAVLTGFYSNGEISPSGPNGQCSLHNQTMTVTTLSES
ncbi:MAG: hypothetical protein RI959_373 [Pseudomonadota bacterium]|jgi:hypothetical protein